MRTSPIDVQGQAVPAWSRPDLQAMLQYPERTASGADSCCESDPCAFTQASDAATCRSPARGSAAASCAATAASTDDLPDSCMVATAWAPQQQSIGSELAHAGHVDGAQQLGGEEGRLPSARDAPLPRLLSSGRTASPTARQQRSPRSLSAARCGSGCHCPAARRHHAATSRGWKRSAGGAL